MAMNIYEMYVQNGGADFWIQRNSWGSTCARVIFVGELNGRPPYYGNPTAKMDVYNLKTGELKDENTFVSCPGTGGYRQINPPSWVQTATLRKIDSTAGHQNVLDAYHKQLTRNEKTIEAQRQIPKRLIVSRYQDRVTLKELGAKWSLEDKAWFIPEDDAEKELAITKAGFRFKN